MKLKFLSTAIVLFITSLCLAKSVDLPSGCYALDEIKEAQEKAIQRKQPIMFLLTDEDTDAGGTAGVSNTMIKKLKSKAVIIYVPNKSGTLPKKVADSLNKRGKYLPKAAIFDIEIENEIALLICEDVFKKKSSTAFKDVKKAIHEYRKTLK